jgi:centromere protein C
MEGAGFKQTRSGRSSIKPLAYWKNEKVEFSENVVEDNFGRFNLWRIKEVVRADALEEPKRVRSKSKAPKTKKRAAEPESEEEDDDTEPWELDPGRVWGDIRNWDPEDQTGSLAEETQEELALSSAAIITRDIAGATFRFAKTLTLPFFGSGMVDLPPGAMKKPKNSRKMQMVFFVFYGRVQVTVNDTKFRIGKGGMWQVPRGKYPATVLVNQSNFRRKLLQH